MSKIKNVMISRECFDACHGLMDNLIKEGIVNVIFYKKYVVVGRHGTNKYALREIAVKEFK